MLYRNDSRNDNAWLMVRLHDNTTANRFGVGAKVRVLASLAGKPQEAELLDSGSYESSNPLELHFGFGPGVKTLAEVEVLWPGDPTPQVLRNVPTDRYLNVSRR